MKNTITSRLIKFFILGIFALLIFTIIYDWDHFKRGLLGKPPHKTTQTEKID